jgi:hypothetical protein
LCQRGTQSPDHRHHRAAERANFPNEVVEMALARTIGDKSEAAYRRGDLFEKRRKLMADWATSPAASTRGKLLR